MSPLARKGGIQGMQITIINKPINLMVVLSLSFIVCLAANIIQGLIGWTRNLGQKQDVLDSLQAGTFPKIYLFEEVCSRQFQNIQHSLLLGKFSEYGYTFSAIYHSFFGDIAILIIVFLFFGIVSWVYGPILFKKQLSIFLPVYSILLLSDQIRYYYTSIHDTGKRLYTWSSYCFHGELGWTADIVGYMAMYIPVALAIAGMLSLLKSLEKTQLDIKKVGFGVEAEIDVVEGSFKWLRVTAIVFFIVWTTTNDLNKESSILYALQAILIFVFIAYIYTRSLYFFHKLDDWHLHEKEKLRDKVAEKHGIPPEEVLDERLKAAGLQDNIYLRHVGRHRTIAFANLWAIILPALGFLDTWFPFIDDIVSTIKG